MKSLVIIEHDGKNIKQTSLSTITAAGKISKEVEVIALGSDISEVVDKLKKTDIISKVNYSDDDFLRFQIAENLSEVITSFLKEKDFSHILLPSSTFGKNLGPKIATTLDVQQISDIIEIFDHETFARPIYAGNAISKVKSKTPVLDNFGRDLTLYASEGKLDPIIGRNKEIERVGFGKRLGSSLLDFTISLLPGIVLGIYAGAGIAQKPSDLLQFDGYFVVLSVNDHTINIVTLYKLLDAD